MIPEYVILLAEVINLEPVGDHDLISTLYDICSSYEGALSENDMFIYTTFEISQRFDVIEPTELNFILNDTSKWERLLSYQSSELSYVISLHIVLRLIENSIVNKQSFAKHPAMKSFIKCRLHENGLDPMLEATLGELYCNIFAVMATSDDIRYVYEKSYPYKWSILEKIAKQITDQSFHTHLLFENSYLRYSDLKIPSSFTLEITLELLNTTSNRLVTLGRSLYLEVRDAHICLSNDEYILALFDGFEFELGFVFSITFCFDSGSTTLFVDNVFIQTISLISDATNNLTTVEVGSMLSYFVLFKFAVLKCCLLPNQISASSKPSTSKDSMTTILDLDIDEIIAESKKDVNQFTLTNVSDSFPNGKCLFYQPSDVVGLLLNMNVLETFLYRLILENNNSLIRTLTDTLLKYLENPIMNESFQNIQGYTTLNYILMLKSQIGYKIDAELIEHLAQIFTSTNNNIDFDKRTASESPLKLILNFRLIDSANVTALEQVFVVLKAIFKKSSCCNLRSSSESIAFLQRAILFQLQSSYSTADITKMATQCNKSLTDLLTTLLHYNVRTDGSIVHLQYSYFCLKTGNTALAAILLQTLNSTFEQYQEDSLELLCKSIPINLYVKVVLILMQNSTEHLEILKTTYSLLLKLFRNQPGFFDQFMNNNGYKILSSILSTHSKSASQLLAAVVMTGASHNKFKNESYYKNFIYPADDRVTLFSHLLAINLVESFIKRNPFDVQEFLLDFIEYLEKVHQKNAKHIIFSYPYSILQSIFGLQIDLEMSSVEMLLTTVNKRSKALLAEFIVQKMKHLDGDSFTKLIAHFCIYTKDPKIPKRNQLHQRIGFIFLIVPEIMRKLSDFTFSVTIRNKSKCIVIENILTLLNAASVSWKVHDACWDTLSETNSVILNFKEMIIKSNLDVSFQERTLKSLNSVHQEMYNWIFADAIHEETRIGPAVIEKLFHSMLYYQEVLFIERYTETALGNEVLSNILTFIKHHIPMLAPDIQFLGLNVFRTICALKENSLPGISKMCSTERAKVLKLLTDTIKHDDQVLFRMLELPKNEALFNKSTKRLQALYATGGMQLEGQRRASRSQFLHVLFSERTDQYNRSMADCSAIYSLFRKDNVNLNKRMFSVEERRSNDYSTDASYQNDAGYSGTSRIVRKVASTVYLRDFKSKREWYLSARENYKRQRIQLLPLFEPVDNIPALTLKIPDVSFNKATLKHSDTASTITLTEGLGSIAENEGFDENVLDKNRAVLQLLKEDERIINIWNATNITGLSVYPGVLVVTNSFLYFIRGCFYNASEKKVVDLETLSESLKDSTIDLLSANLMGKSSKSDAEMESLRFGWDINDLNYTIKRPFLLRNTAMELFFGLKNTIMFNFKDQNLRDDVFTILKKLTKSHQEYSIWSSILAEVNFKSNKLGVNNGISRTSISDKFSSALTNITKKHASEKILNLWQTGALSNFDYLMALNTLAGRTFNDLTQYPVFPWVISDYDSENIDIENANIYRDLSKPMGAQSQQRMANFIERYEALTELEDKTTPPFHYGTHYSSAMIVSSYLVRLQPFADTYRILQGNQWGPPDRLFNSVSRAWKSASSEATTDVREVIPEFYYLPDFLVNKNSYNFGIMQDGKEATDVILPPWAKNDPKMFVEINRQALESRYVSDHLHEWIDIIFGFKQRGKEAIDAVNVFNSLSYSGNVDIDGIDNDNERRAITSIIHNFGQTPLQIFQHPHPARKPHAYSKLNDKVVSNLNSVKPYSEMITDINDGTFSPTFLHKELKINQGGLKCAHSSQITFLSKFSKFMVATGDSIGLIKIWKVDKGEACYLKSLCGHESSIKSINASMQYDTILSLDDRGTAIVWDMRSGLVINKFTTLARFVAISPTTGNIALFGEKGISMFDINSSIYCLHEISGNISAIAFLDRNMMWPYTYHEEIDTLLVATGNKIVPYSFRLVQQEWKLIPQQPFSNHQVDSIVEIKFKVKDRHNLTEKSQVGMMMMITVDKNGKSWSWGE